MYLFLILGRCHIPTCSTVNEESIIKNTISFNHEYLNLIKSNKIFLSMYIAALSSHPDIEKINN